MMKRLFALIAVTALAVCTFAQGPPTEPPKLTIPTNVSYMGQFDFKSKAWSNLVLGPSVAHYHADNVLGFKGLNLDFDAEPVVGVVDGDNGAAGLAFVASKLLRPNVRFTFGARGLAVQHGKPTGAIVLGLQLGA